jgi:hypothetical protein
MAHCAVGAGVYPYEGVKGSHEALLHDELHRGCGYKREHLRGMYVSWLIVYLTQPCAE